jgi:hypothetical protein
MSEGSYRIFKSVWLCALGFTIALLAQRADTLMREVTDDWPALAGNSLLALESLKTALASVQVIELNTTRTEAEMAGLLNQTRHSMMTPAQTKELVDRAANLMDNANLSVIRLGEAADSLRGIPPTVQGAIQQIATDAHNTMQGSQAMIKAATDDLSQPEIKGTTIAIEEAAQATAATTANLADATKDIKDFVHRETAPARGTWHGLKAAINFVWSIRGAIGF